MSNPPPSLPLPVRLCACVFATGLVCLTLMGWGEYRLALEGERRSLQEFAHGVTQAFRSHTKAEATHHESSLVSQRLQAVRGSERVGHWRIIDGHDPQNDSASAPDGDATHALDTVVWTPETPGHEILRNAAFAERLVVRVPLGVDASEDAWFESIIDGRERHHTTVVAITQRLVPPACGFLATALVLLLATRRWVSQPLAKAGRLLASDDPAGTSRTRGGQDPRRLVGSIQSWVRRHEDEQQRQDHQLTLHRTMADTAAKSLLVIDDQGIVLAVNLEARRALTGNAKEAVTDRPLWDWLAPAQQDALRQALATAIDPEVSSAEPAHFRLRLRSPTALHGTLYANTPEPRQAVISLEPRTAAEAIQDALVRQRTLLQAAADALETPWLLSDLDGVVLTHNQDWAARVGLDADALTRSPLTRNALWSALGREAEQACLEAVERALAEPSEPTTQALETALGVLELRSRLVMGANQEALGLAWTLVDRPDDASPRRLDLEATEPAATAPSLDLASFASDLCEARSTHLLLEAAVQAMQACTGVDAAGIAVRSAARDHDRRSEQRMAGGSVDAPMPLATFGRLREAVESELMPETMGSPGSVVTTMPTTSGWPDALREAGLGRFAAATLAGVGEELGVLWIAQRRGQPLPEHAQQALQRVVDLVGARFEALRWRESFSTLGLVDADTGLPTTPTLMRHFATLPIPATSSDSTPPSVQLLVFTAEGAAHPTSTGFVDDIRASADALRARCRRGVFLARTGPAEFVAVVEGLARQHAKSLGERLVDMLNTLPRSTATRNASTDRWRFGMAEYAPVPGEPTDRLAESAFADARADALEPSTARRLAS